MNAEAAAELSVLTALPELRSYRRVLYVGANVTRFHLYGVLAGKEIHVLEVFGPYVEALRRDRRFRLARVIQGSILDVDQIAELTERAPFDLLVWWHGPEHVEVDAASELLRPGGAVHRLYTGAILLGCPWGVYKQGAVDGNEWQEHRCHLLPEFFVDLGYEVYTVGKPNSKEGHITAWKRALRAPEGARGAVAVDEAGNEHTAQSRPGPPGRMADDALLPARVHGQEQGLGR